MNPNLNNLYAIANKNSRVVIGLMSGTSLDGLDIAVCKINGYGTSTELKLLNFITVKYDNGFKEKIREVFSKKFSRP